MSPSKTLKIADNWPDGLPDTQSRVKQQTIAPNMIEKYQTSFSLLVLAVLAAGRFSDFDYKRKFNNKDQ